MKANIRKTAIALAVAAAAAASPAAFAQDNQNASANIDHQHNVNETRTNTNTLTNTTTNNNTTNTTVHDVNTTLNAEANLLFNATTNLNFNGNYSDDVSNAETYNTTENYWSNEVYENIVRTEVVNSDIRKEGNEHQIAVSLNKDLSLTSDINFSGNPEITGSIDLDSAAIAVIDNRQSISNNLAGNELLTNDASIADDVGSDASGNMGFNVAAGDNNTQDNAASLSAADASFSFGMADAEVFVNQAGFGNTTINYGVTNSAGVGGNAFSGATGNIGVNVTSGNNNEQKNALAASVATTAYAQSSISSNQVSTGNIVGNSGYAEAMTNTTDVTLTGTVTAADDGGMGTYTGTGSAYQQTNFYPDHWSSESHPGGSGTGHSDWDIDTQGAVANPNRPGVGGMAWDTEESGVIDLSDLELVASLTGTVTTTSWLNVDATNTASLSGSAFSAASGNIGVNVSAGTGNLQANSLALAVAQPSAAPGGGGGGGETP